MPAMLREMNCAGTKFISGNPANPKNGYNYIHGLYIIDDMETGIPLTVMDCIELTAIRTGAVTGLSAKYMARQNSESVFFFGAGTQGRMGLDGYMCTLPNINRVYMSDISEAAIMRYKEQMEAKYPQIEVIPVNEKNVEDAVRDSDIINSCIPSTDDPSVRFIKKEWLKPNVTCMPVDAGMAFFPDAMNKNLYARTYTDDVAQLNHYMDEENFMEEAERTPIELGEVITGKKPGRLNDDERILTLMMGTGLADLGAAKFIYDKALKEGIGTIMPL